MRTTLVTLFCYFIAFQTYAQLETSYLEPIRRSPKSLTLDILEQKKEGNDFSTKKHTRYELTLNGPTIISQKVYDTISNVAYNKSLTYNYDATIDNNLIEIVQNDFSDKLMKRIQYTYDDRGLLLLKEEHFDGDNVLLKTITHDFGGCKDAAVLEGLPADASYTCSTKKFANRVSTRSWIEVYGGMGLLAKEIHYKGDGTLSKTEFSEYDTNWNLTKQSKKTASGRGYNTIYTYNEQGDVATKKAGYVEFYYIYTYDDKGNWTQMIETSKVKSKRRVYNRSFAY